MKQIPMLCCSVATLFALTLTSCETPEGRGAAVGAASGAVIGAIAGHPGRGAAIGAVSGAALGHLIARSPRHYYDDHPGDYVYEGRRMRELPYARPTNRRGFVTSPYRPHALVDVRGIPRGAVVRDPASGGHFVNP